MNVFRFAINDTFTMLNGILHFRVKVVSLGGLYFNNTKIGAFFGQNV